MNRFLVRHVSRAPLRQTKNRWLCDGPATGGLRTLWDGFAVTGGPCAELVALAVARAAGARAPRLIVSVGDAGRGVLAPCGRDRQVLADYFPDIHVIVPTDEGLQVVQIGDLLPHTYRWQTQRVQRLRFRATHLPAVRDGSKRVTMRLRDPVQVGSALLVFEFDDEVSILGRITSTVAKPVGSVTDDEAREDGFASAADVLPGLRNYYPEPQSTDEIVIVASRWMRTDRDPENTSALALTDL